MVRRTARCLGFVAVAWALSGCPQDVTPLPGGDKDAGTPSDAGPTPDAGGPRCGDGRADPGETCDGPDLGGTTCADVGLGAGTLACNADCRRFDLSGCQACTPQCGARVCGLEDTCNSSCGACETGEACTSQGACVPSCELGSYACTPDGHGFQACGPNDALGIQDLGPRVGCAGGAECGDGLGRPCARPSCVPADVMVVVDRGAGLSLDSAWSWMRDELVRGLARRDHVVRLGLRQFPTGACAVGPAAPFARDAAQSLGQSMTSPGAEASTPLHRALAGLEGSFTPGQDAQAVLLITGGDETCDPAEQAVLQAARLHRMGVRVYVVALTPRANRALLDRIAEAGGTHQARQADDARALGRAVEEVFTELGTCTNPTPVVAAGYYHACRLLDGVIRCWGRTDDARLAPPPGPHRHVAAGTDNACAVGEDGVVRCWGRDHRGQSSPRAGTFVQVSGGDSHFCGLQLDGRAACWGYDDVGQASPPMERMTQVTAGGFFSCGIREVDDTVVCWGGHPALSGTFQQIDGGSFSLCGVATDGSLACNGITDPVPTGSFVQVSAGADHACAVRVDGEVRCWGLDHVGQSTPPAGPFVAVDVNNEYSCAARPDGAVVCWGDGSNGQTSPPP